MKVFGLVMKIVVALAAVAGAVYLAATYGDRIVAWAKRTIGSKFDCCCCDDECDCDCDCEEAFEADATEASEADFEG